MKTINWTEKKQLRYGILHIETPNGIVNINVGLTDLKGRPVDSINFVPDRYYGEGKVVIYPSRYNTRMVRLKTIVKRG